MESILFNTGRQYSDKGQRIAAAIAPNGVIVMVDIDRGLDYALPEASLNQQSIMNSYDDPSLQTNVDYCFNNDYQVMYSFLRELNNLANAI